MKAAVLHAPKTDLACVATDQDRPRLVRLYLGTTMAGRIKLTVRSVIAFA